MFIIGLDLSINYSSYTILDTDRNEVSFGSVINDVSISKKKMDRLSDLSSMTEGLYFDFTSSAGNKTSVHQLDYLNCERMKLLNYIEISKLLCNSINKVTKKSSDVVIGVEGFSYGSNGMAVFDVPMLTGIIREHSLGSVLGFDVNRMFVFPPSDLKKEFGCKGNADKGVIFKEFIKDPKLDVVKNSQFYDFLLRNKDDKSVSSVNASGKTIVESPFNDIIDSYLSVYKIFKNMSAE